MRASSSEEIKCSESVEVKISPPTTIHLQSGYILRAFEGVDNHWQQGSEHLSHIVQHYHQQHSTILQNDIQIHCKQSDSIIILGEYEHNQFSF